MWIESRRCTRVDTRLGARRSTPVGARLAPGVATARELGRRRAAETLPQLVFVARVALRRVEPRARRLGPWRAVLARCGPGVLRLVAAREAGRGPIPETLAQLLLVARLALASDARQFRSDSCKSNLSKGAVVWRCETASNRGW